MPRSVDQILESMRQTMQEGVAKGNIHFNVPNKNYLSDLKTKVKDSEEVKRLLASAPQHVRDRWLK